MATPSSTLLSELAALASVALGAYGSYNTNDYKALAAAVYFSAGFIWARARVASGQPSQALQLLLMLTLVAASFALHLLYLPAGICCFFTLMLCKNELLLPPNKSEQKRE